MKNKLIIVLTAVIIALAAVVYFFMNKSSELDFASDDETTSVTQSDTTSLLSQIVQNVTEIPQKVKEQIAAPVIDTLISKVVKTDNVDGTTIFTQKSKSLPIEAKNISVSGNTISFDLTLQTNHFGNVNSSVKMRGNQINWPGRYGFVAEVQGEAVAKMQSSKGQSNTQNGSLRDLLGQLPNNIVDVPDDTSIQAAMCMDYAGKVVLVKSDTMSTLAQMKTLVQSMGLKSAIFIPGHLAYDGSVGVDGLKIRFVSYQTPERPDGYSRIFW